MKPDTAADLRLSRRGAMASMIGAGGAAAALSLAEAQAKTTAPLKALAGEVKRVNIKSIEIFDVLIPQPAGAKSGTGQIRTPGRVNVVRVETDSGVRGYSFLGSTAADVKAAIPVLVGQDLFAIEAHLKRGLIAWGAIEEAMWDAIGRIAGQPVSRLLGGASLKTVPVYVTCVWETDRNRERIPPAAQAGHATALRQAGFKAMKIQIMRADYNVDVEACSMLLANGGEGFRVMVDRTANVAGLWTWEQGLGAARACQKAGVYWLEEPFARDDYESPARLVKEVDIIITGGEGYRGLEPYKQCLMHGTYEILQPEVRQVSGLLTTRKVGALAQAWGLEIAPHGTCGLALAGRVQVSSAMGSVYQEISVLTPPALPDDVTRPFLPLVHGEQPFKFVGGEIVVPQGPGLGLNIDEAAIKRYRVEDLEVRQPPPPRPA